MPELHRVAVTGLGIISPIGNNANEVVTSLYKGRSGIVFCDNYAERGFRCHVHGAPVIDLDDHIDRKLRRFMGDGSAYNYVAMQEAITSAGLSDSEVTDERTGLVMGSGGPSTSALVTAADTAREKGAKRVGPYAVPKAMCSTNSANLSTAFHMRGLSYSISSACSTSAHCIGNGAELIQWGKQDVVFAGGGEELHWTLTVLFDAMGALSSKYTDTPERPRGRSTPTAMASSLPAVAALLCSRKWSAQRPAVPKFTPKSPAMAPRPMASTWSHPQAKVPCGACAWQPRAWVIPRSTTSTPMAPRRRPAT